MRIMPTQRNVLPNVTIVGCPNVGKSSLFNRIVKKRKAIVYMEVGTTRDRISQEVVHNNKRFILSDTGGFIQEDESQIIKLVRGQIKKAIEQSEILLFVCDGTGGINSHDLELANLLRKAGKKIILVVNKVDNKKVEEGIIDFYEFGLGKPYPVSSLHNLGVNDLLDDLVKQLPEGSPETEENSRAIKTAIVGKPNVGKSSFLNSLLKEERAIVDKVPGTTRDSVDTLFSDGDTEFLLIDTAGMRHKRKVKEAVDVYSIMRSLEAVKRSDVCVVLIDGFDGIRSDDLKILNLVFEDAKSCVLCINKWDLVRNIPEEKYKELIYHRADFLKKYPILFISAKTGHNVARVIETIKEVVKKSYTQVPTTSLNKLFNSIKSKGSFLSRKNPLKIYYGTQINAHPPKFLIFVDDAKRATELHKNIIENAIRRHFDFFGVTIKIEFRSSKGGRK